MGDLSLKFAGASYPDRTAPLIDGRVKPEGIDLDWIVIHSAHEMFRRMLVFNEFDASEMSAGYYIALKSQGDDRFVGVPVFPGRHFRHGNIYVRSDAGIEKPDDLKWKRAGVPEYPMTAAVWIRALLLQDYGVRAADLEWFQGGFDTPGFETRSPLELAPEIRLTTIPQDKSLVGMLLDGELDVLIGPSKPKAYASGDPRVRRLFPQYREMEKDYYRRTGIYPIDHMVVVKREVYERNPWVPGSLLSAFTEARDLGWSEFLKNNAGNPLPWFAADLEEVDELFKGKPFSYGFTANRPVIEAATVHLLAQGIAQRKVDPEELFAPETLVS